MHRNRIAALAITAAAALLLSGCAQEAPPAPAAETPEPTRTASSQEQKAQQFAEEFMSVLDADRWSPAAVNATGLACETLTEDNFYIVGDEKWEIPDPYEVVLTDADEPSIENEDGKTYVYLGLDGLTTDSEPCIWGVVSNLESLWQLDKRRSN